jgi:hypothetical protein
MEEGGSKKGAPTTSFWLVEAADAPCVEIQRKEIWAEGTFPNLKW